MTIDLEYIIEAVKSLFVEFDINDECYIDCMSTMNVEDSEIQYVYMITFKNKPKENIEEIINIIKNNADFEIDKINSNELDTIYFTIGVT